jgi:diacylglycerol kinase (ATP)
MSRRVLAIINPISGRRDMTPVVQEVGLWLRRAGGELHVESTRTGGHATELARTHAPAHDVVLVAGGDGTVAEVVNGLLETPRPILILRTGTENLLAREFSMPTDPRRTARLLIEGQPIDYDVGCVNGRGFLSISGIGFDAEVVHRFTRQRSGHITHGDYFWPIWRTFWAHRFPMLRVWADGELVFEGRGLAFVGVLPRYSLNLRVLRDARFDDGLLDLCVLPCASRLRFVRHVLHVLQGRHVEDRTVVYRQVRTVSIESPEADVPVEVDGDNGGYLPGTWTVLRGAARFLRMPPGSGAVCP